MREEKKLLKKEIANKLQQFQSFVVMQYAGLNANMANEFRREITKLGGDVEVMRKTMLQKAAADADIELQSLSLDGHVGVVFLGEDPLEMVKMVFKFSQDREKVIHVLGGRFDGLLYSSEDVERMSTLPGKDEMRAQLLSIFEAPLSQTLAVMEALLTSVPHCLQNKSEHEETTE
jgi:large subunit ribosomal protein L10